MLWFPLLSGCDNGTDPITYHRPREVTPLAAVVDPETVPLVRTVTVTTASSAPVTAVCTDDDGVGDRYELEDDGDSDTRRFVLSGLLSETTYACTVSTLGADDATVTFDTPAAPGNFPVTTLSGTGSTDEYTIFFHTIWDKKLFTSTDAALFVVDPLGRVRWSYDLDTDLVDVDAHALGNDQILYGGAHFVPTILGTDHGAIHQFAGDELFSHEVTPLSHNRILTLVYLSNTSGKDEFTGFEVSVRDLDTEEVLWSWASQSAVDSGFLAPGSAADHDPYHANAAQLLEGDAEPHLVLVSLKDKSQIIGIDYDTGLPLWKLGKGGDFALVDSKGAPLDAEQWFSGQHAIEAHWPRILMFDNGPTTLRSDGTSSRALEIAIDLDAMTVTPTWSFADGAVHDGLGGDANRLESGNVLFTEPNCLPCDSNYPQSSRIMEVTSAGEVVWQLDFDSERDMLYRAERVDPCELFSNRLYCSDP